MPPSIEKLIKEKPDSIKELKNYEDIENLLSHKEIEEEDKLNLSYSSIDTYSACSLSYYLKHGLNFRVSSDSVMDYGNVVHNSLEIINNAVKEGKGYLKKMFF